jgi:carbon monoxide dehydrogenase subunit G
MQFHHGFSVAAPAGTVWTTITDIERVAPCVPNTRVTGRAGAAGFDIEITATVGPFEVTAAGTITLAERDDGAHREVLTIIARDADGDTLADATVTIVLTGDSDGAATDGAVHTDVELGGIATLVAQDTLDQVAGDTLRTFAANLEALVRPTPG